MFDLSSPARYYGITLPSYVLGVSDQFKNKTNKVEKQEINQHLIDFVQKVRNKDMSFWHQKYVNSNREEQPKDTIKLDLQISKNIRNINNVN